MTKEEIQALIAEALSQAGFIKQADMNATAALLRQLREDVTGLKGQNPLEETDNENHDNHLDNLVFQVIKRRDFKDRMECL